MKLITYNLFLPNYILGCIHLDHNLLFRNIGFYGQVKKVKANLMINIFKVLRWNDMLNLPTNLRMAGLDN